MKTKMDNAIASIKAHIEEIETQLKNLKTSDPAARREDYYTYITTFPSHFSYVYTVQSKIEYVLSHRKLLFDRWYARKVIAVKEDHIKARNNLELTYFKEYAEQLKAKRELSQKDIDAYILKKFGWMYQRHQQILLKLDQLLTRIKGLKTLLLELNQLIRTLLADIREDLRTS